MKRWRPTQRSPKLVPRIGCDGVATEGVSGWADAGDRGIQDHERSWPIGKIRLLGRQSYRSRDQARRLRARVEIDVVAAEGCIVAQSLHRCPTNSWASMRMEGIYGGV